MYYVQSNCSIILILQYETNKQIEYTKMALFMITYFLGTIGSEDLFDFDLNQTILAVACIIVENIANKTYISLFFYFSSRSLHIHTVYCC